MRGWSVFTRPPSISGNSVRSSTLVTSRPSSRIESAVPPLATSSQPSEERPFASVSRPVLSKTEISARLTSLAAFRSRPAEPGSAKG